MKKALPVVVVIVLVAGLVLGYLFLPNTRNAKQFLSKYYTIGYGGDDNLFAIINQNMEDELEQAGEDGLQFDSVEEMNEYFSTVYSDVIDPEYEQYFTESEYADFGMRHMIDGYASDYDLRLRCKNICFAKMESTTLEKYDYEYTLKLIVDYDDGTEEIFRLNGFLRIKWEDSEWKIDDIMLDNISF